MTARPIIAALEQFPRLAALLLGIVAATAYPPLSLWPVGLAALTVFVWLIFAAPGWRAAAMRGWLFGLGHLALANNWIATAFTFQSDMPPALGWLAVPLIATYLALYPALAAGVAHALAARRGALPFTLAFAGAWIVTEWLRSWLFTGYPWPPLGLMLLGPFDKPGLAAILPWLGTYALSGLAILLVGFGAWLAMTQRWIGLGVLCVVVTGAMLRPVGVGEEGTLALTLVQPDLQQGQLHDPAFYERHFARTAALSRWREGDPDGPRLVLWPESSIPDFLEDGYPPIYYRSSTAGGDPRIARERIARAIGANSLLLAGVTDLEFEGETAIGARNAVSGVDAQGQLVASYDKAHLVPFGEYVPLRPVLEPLGLARFVPGAFDFWPGPGPRTLDLGPWGKAGVQVCYEIIFSGRVTDREDRPDYIFNPSNDGWYGHWGPPQHLAQARLRAIEEGLPVLRSMTTGISAVIDARGVVRASIGLNRDGRIDGRVPPAHTPTLFSRWGNALPLAWAFLLIGGSLVASRARHR